MQYGFAVFLAFAATAMAQSTVLFSSCPPSASVTASSSAVEAAAPYPTTTYTNPLTAVYSTGATAPTGSPKPTVPFTGAASANKVGAVLVGAVAGVVAIVM